MWFILKTWNLLETSIKYKKIHRVLQINQSLWLKPYIEFKTQKRTEPEKNGDRVGKLWYKLMNNIACRKTMENWETESM